jgi:DNA polymerase-3 subunit beta
MRFIVSSAALLKQLQSINGVITTNPVVPILENFLFEIEDGMLTVTASDLQTTMITQMSVEANENGRIAVPARILIETLRNLPEQPVTISIDSDTYSIEINSDNGRYKLAGENASDFPQVPSVDNGFQVKLNTEVLASAISNTIFATSNDELRPAMTGVFVQFSDTNITFVATDGHRLVRYRRVDATADHNISIIIPRKALNLLKAVLPSEKMDVDMEFNGSHAFFSFGSFQMVSRLVDERFPDYENVIPTDNYNHIEMDRSSLISTLRRISIYANKTTYQVRFKITGSEMVISAEDLDFSNEAQERLTCDHTGDDIQIGFNAKFMLEMLNNLDSDQVKLSLSKPNRAGLITPTEKSDEEDTLMLVMPVMLASSYS